MGLFYNAIRSIWRALKIKMGRRSTYHVNEMALGICTKCSEPEMVTPTDMKFLTTHCRDAVDRELTKDEILDKILLMVCREEDFLLAPIRETWV